MYNGIGLETARGSGTNGYVQRNLSFIRRHKDNVDYKSEEELRKLDSELNRGPSREILDHERKRKVELKCMEMQELMEEQGYSEEEISSKVSVYRRMLMENLEMPSSAVSGSTVEKDDAGRPVAKQTHQLAEASQARNDQLRAAFGLSEFYKDGSSLDPQRKAKEQAAEALAAATKKYTMVPDDSSSSSSSSTSPSPSPEKKKKHRVKRKRQERDKDDERERRDEEADKSQASDEERVKKRKSSASNDRRHRQTEDSETRPRHSRLMTQSSDAEEEQRGRRTMREDQRRSHRHSHSDSVQHQHRSSKKHSTSRHRSPEQHKRSRSVTK